MPHSNRLDDGNARWGNYCLEDLANQFSSKLKLAGEKVTMRTWAESAKTTVWFVVLMAFNFQLSGFLLGVAA